MTKSTFLYVLMSFLLKRNSCFSVMQNDRLTCWVAWKSYDRTYNTCSWRLYLFCLLFCSCFFYIFFYYVLKFCRIVNFSKSNLFSLQWFYFEKCKSFMYKHPDTFQLHKHNRFILQLVVNSDLNKRKTIKL